MNLKVIGALNRLKISVQLLLFGKT